MEFSYINAAIAGLVYSVAAIFAKRALAEGAGTLRLSFVINLVFVPVFAIILLRHEGAIPWEQWLYPALTGSLFFLGQVFTFAAIRVGDVSLQTPMMGTKAVFVVIIAVFLGTEEVGLTMILAAVISMLAVALLGFSGIQGHKVSLTLGLALLSALFFAGSDTMFGAYGRDFGVPMFLFVAICVNALLSFALIPFFNGGMREISRAAWPWMLLAAVLMAGQALLLNFTLASYQNVAAINVLYTTRGLWSVLLGLVVVGAAVKLSIADRRIFKLRLAGALMMCAAIGILFYPQSS